MIADAGHLWIKDSGSRCRASFGRQVGLDDRYTRGGPIAGVKPFGDPTLNSMTGTAGTIDGGTLDRFALEHCMVIGGLAV